jgi:hypothetical protein
MGPQRLSWGCAYFVNGKAVHARLHAVRAALHREQRRRAVHVTAARHCHFRLLRRLPALLDGRRVEEGRQLLRIKRCGGHDDAQVGPPALHLLQQAQQRVAGQAALVRLVHHDHAAGRRS